MFRLVRFLPAPAPLLAAGVLLGASPAQAGVTSPQAVSPKGLIVQQSAVGVGGGRTVLLMAGYTRSGRTNRYSLSARLGQVGGLGRLQRLAVGGGSPQLAVGPDGTAVAVWIEHRRRGETVLRAAIAGRGRGFGRSQTVSQGRSIQQGGVAVTPTGSAVVAWGAGISGTPVQVAVAAPGKGFGAAQTVGVSQQYAPVVSVAPSGATLLAWLETPLPQPPPAPRPGPARLLYATLEPGTSRFGPAAELATLGFSGWSAPEAANGPGGAAVTTGGKLFLLTSANVFQYSVPLPPQQCVGGEAGEGCSTALGIPADGSVDAIWRDVRTRTAENPTLTFAAIRSSLRPAGGAFSPGRQISSAGWFAGRPRGGALPDRTVAAWSEGRGNSGARVRVAVRRVGHDWTSLSPLSASGVDAGTVILATSQSRAVIAWIQRFRPFSRESGRLYLASYRP